MRVERDQATIKFIWPSQPARGKIGCSSINLVTGMTEELIQNVIKVMISLCNGKSLSFIKALMSSLREVFSRIDKHLGRWPLSEEWPIVIYNIYAAQILEGQEARKINSSRTRWLNIKRILERFGSVAVMPSMRLPSAAGRPRIKGYDPRTGEVLGESHQPVSPAAFSDSAKLKSYLRDITYTKDESEFFSGMQQELQSASDLVFALSQKYWTDMLRCHEVGRGILASVSRADLLKAMSDPRWQDVACSSKRHIAYPGTREGLAYFLGALSYHFFEARTISKLSYAQVNNIPFLKVLAGTRQRNRRIFFESLARELGSEDSSDNNICRALGVLTTRDCAVATSILIHEQPRFNPESLWKADAFDSNGKLLISVVSEALWFEGLEEAVEILEFTVAKERAKARKGGLLSPAGSKTLWDVERLTARLREKASFEQPDVARKLFLTVSKHGFGHAGRIGAYFNSKKELSFFDCVADELTSAGFGRENCTLAKVRNTQGILVWLKTGSVAAMAAAMGNSIKCVLDCYIPDWIYRRMLVRIARRFQQKLILLSTASTPWAVSASDFDSYEELEDTVIKLLSSNSKGNPLSAAFSKAFSNLSGEVVEHSGAHGKMYISLTPASIAALEVFVRRNPLEVDRARFSDKADRTIGLYDLYDLIYAAVHSESSDGVDQIILDLISGGSRAQLQAIWKKSRDLISDFESKLKITASQEG